GLSGLVRERFGKTIKGATQKAINDELTNEDSDIAGNKGKFVEFITNKLEKEMDITKPRDRERLAKAAGDYWQYKREGVNGDALVDALIKKSGLLGLL
ncbi:hypothetical protein, partial [Stenotrophomonas maltophilia]